jgi:hypothetical protein
VTASRPDQHQTADSVREFAPDVNCGVSSQIARLCTRAPAEPAVARSSTAMRTPYRKRHVTVRARTRCRLAVLPRDRLDSQARRLRSREQTLQSGMQRLVNLAPGVFCLERHLDHRFVIARYFSSRRTLIGLGENAEGAAVMELSTDPDATGAASTCRISHSNPTKA